MNSRIFAARQKGAALLLMMLVILTAATAVLATRLSAVDVRARRLADTGVALAQARAALVDYASVYSDLTAGQLNLPCPDLDETGGFLEGEAHTSACGARGVTMLGRLPWKTLGIAPPADGASECLWYVVSGAYKEAGGATAEMINPDTNGQLQLYGIEAGTVVEGAQAQYRPVAMIIAAMGPVNAQTRASASTGSQCSDSYLATNFLDTDSASGISNAVLSGLPDSVEMFASGAGYQPTHNDRIAVVTRADIERAATGRNDFEPNMRSLGSAIALCLANYASNNPGGMNDRRLPWPAALGLSDYRPDASYDDIDSGDYSGRFPDIVNDSNVTTGNSIGRVLTDCDSSVVVEWTPDMLSRWRNWKDHFYYAVAESYAPDAVVPSSCTTCLTVNGVGQYAAVLLFANSRLPLLGQVRNAPPIDADTRDDASNYLELGNLSNMPYTGGIVDFSSLPVSANFNDLLFCIDDTLNVTEC